MNWRRPRRMHRAKVTAAASRALLAVLLCGVLAQRHAAADDTPLKFAIIADALTKPADEAPVRQMLDTISRDRDIAFIVYDGNIKGSAEPCRDKIFEGRRDLLDASRKPLIVVPGQHDWTDCGLAQSGAYDPVERLDFLRQLFFADANTLGAAPLSVTRESEVARFRTFRENVRWQSQGVAFVGLNAPSPNNHYLTAGGRNGEFEDRVIANTFWLEHAAEWARRAEQRALVVILQGDPDFTRYERRDRFAWLRFTRNNPPRDGFVEFKRSLVKMANSFRGPVIVIHGSETALPAGYRIDQPLRDEKGAVVANLTRIAIAFKKPQAQWLEVQTNAGWRPPFKVDLRDVAGRSKTVEANEPATAEPAPSPPRDDLPPATLTPMPPILTPPPALPPILPTPASGVQNGIYRAAPASAAVE
ncbi:hypothetical protein [Caballeronia humi]|nr:hypothetical protein [Caballeronia humi]